MFVFFIFIKNPFGTNRNTLYLYISTIISVAAVGDSNRALLKTKTRHLHAFMLIHTGRYITGGP